MENLKTAMSYNMLERKHIVRQQYRTSIGIMSEILQIIMDAGMNGVIVSELARKANLSHNTTVEYCQKLIGASLVESARTQKNYIFIVTTKGMEFFREFKLFRETAQELNLRC